MGDLDQAQGKATSLRTSSRLASPETDVIHPVLSSDELELFYRRTNGNMHRTTRQKPNDGFQPGPELAGVPSGATPTWISPGGCDLYYVGLDGGNSGLFRVSRR